MSTEFLARFQNKAAVVTKSGEAKLTDVQYAL